MTFLVASQASLAWAQPFKILHSFGASFDGTNSDGTFPSGGLVLEGETLYGTAPGGGILGNGTLFALKTSGVGFTILHNFSARTAKGNGFFSNPDGAVPQASLLLLDSVLFGTASEGGQWGRGVLFATRINGGLDALHAFTPTAVSGADIFTNYDGDAPQGNLVSSGDATLYGATAYGGAWGNGTVFRVNIDGAGFTTLHSFSETSPWPSYANDDGNSPQTGLLVLSNTLYGVAVYGGTSGNGTLFSISQYGTNFRTLHNFSAVDDSGTNRDGANPYGRLTASGDTLYGTAASAGRSGQGTVFAVKVDGTEFRTLHDFTSTYASKNALTNRDGAYPIGGLTLAGDLLYGTASAGGTFGQGTVFMLKIDGTAFAVLHSFSSISGAYPWTNIDGARPIGELVASGSALYGTSRNGGVGGNGTVFAIQLQPQLTIMRSGENLVLTWPTSATGFALQVSTNLLSSAAWTSFSQSPLTITGVNMVTNAIANSQAAFYRLSQ